MDKVSLARFAPYVIPLDLGTARFAAELATDAYHPYTAQAARAPEGFECSQLLWNHVDGAIMCGTWYEKPVVIVSVRGSEFDLSEWLSNITCWTSCVDWRGIGGGGGGRAAKAHKGFLAGALGIRRQITAFAKAHAVDWQNTIVLLAGHSAGGAIVDILSDWLLSTTGIKPANLLCFTFGAPPIWKRNHGAVFRRYRVLYDDDPVPAARLLFVGPYHVTVPTDHALSPRIKGAYLIDTATTSITPMTSAMASAIHVGKITFLPWRWFSRAKGKVIAHRMSGYRDALRAISRGIATP